MNTVFIVGVIQGVFVITLLFLKRNKTQTERILIVWLSLIVFHLAASYLMRIEKLDNAFIMVLNSIIPFMQGPLLYLYFTSLYAGKPNWLRMSFHFFPALLLIPIQVLPAVDPVIIDLYRIYLMASVPLYILWILRCVKLIATNSEVQVKQLTSWLNIPLIGLGGIWLTFLVFEYLIKLEVIQVGPYFFIAVTAFVYLMALHLYRNGALVKSVQSDPSVRELGDIESVVKYSRSGLNDEKTKAIHKELLVLMENEKPFLEPEISLSSLSESLGTRSNHLSQVINEIEAKSFNDFINGYRIRAFADLYKSGERADDSLLALAFECGFTSKSTFNRIFKKEMGQSPSEYFQKS